MKIFLVASPTPKFFRVLRKAQIENILVSYATLNSVHNYVKSSEGWWPKHLLVDSGAFSVWSKGDKINIDKYANFCLELRDFDEEIYGTQKRGECDIRFVNLDVLPGKFGIRPTIQQREDSAKTGWENMLYLESKGLKVIHVFHQHEKFEWLEKLAQHSNYIGISPANDLIVSKRLPWLQYVFKILTKYPNVKTHGFAVTSLELLLSIPFYSVDSASWISGGKFAVVPTFSKGRFLKTSFKKDLDQLWQNSEDKSVRLLTDYTARLEEGAKAFKKIEQFVNKVWEERGLKV